MALVPQTAENEYKKNPDIKKEDIAKLMDWLEKQTHLPKLPEVEVIIFYHSCESSMELTKSTIDIYYTLRTHLDMFFTERDPMSDRNLYTIEKMLFSPLAKTTPEGYQVIYCRLLDYDPSHFNYEVAAKSFVMVHDLCLYEEGTYPGVVILVDLDKITLGHVARLGIIAVKNTLYYLQEAMPVRLKGFHFLNTPSFMDKILVLMKPFMKKKFTDLLYLHPAPIDSLYKTVPKEILPKELGGEYLSFDEIRDGVLKKLEANRQFFIDEEKKRVDESKRPGKPKNLGEIFGVEGSFKKLSID